MKTWYSIKNKTTDTASISIHDEIGMWGISAAQFISELKAVDAKTLELSIHSPGGNLLDGFAMYNALINHPAKVLGKVEGIAASAASVVLMAADIISMPEDSYLMIHNPHGGAYGQAADLRELADIMDKMQSSIANIYSKRTNQPVSDIIEMLNKETWMTANEAMSLGFTDIVTNKIGVAAKTNLFSDHFKQIPISNGIEVDDIANERDYEKALRDAGVSKSKSVAFVAVAKKLFLGDPRVDENSEKQTNSSQSLDKFINTLESINGHK